MKYLMYILFISLSLKSLSQASNNPSIGNNKLDSLIERLEARNMLAEEQNSDSLNAALAKQLITYKAKEDYFAAALEDQSTRFATIVGAIVGLIGLISFGVVYSERRRVERKLDAFRNEFDQMEDKYKELESNLLYSASNIHVIAAQNLREKGSYVLALDYLLFATVAFIAGQQISGKIYKESIIANLNMAIEDLDNILKNRDSFRESLSEKKNTIIDNINHIQNFNDNEVKDLCAKIRVSINELLDKEKEK